MNKIMQRAAAHRHPGDAHARVDRLAGIRDDACLDQSRGLIDERSGMDA